MNIGGTSVNMTLVSVIYAFLAKKATMTRETDNNTESE